LFLASCLDISNRLQEQQFGSVDELLSRIRKILDEISIDTLEAFFRDWINKLNRCIAALQYCSIAALQYCSIAAKELREMK
jgi:hypothetical protein